MIKVGIIGGGIITDAHLSGLSAISDAKVVALCSLDKPRLRKLSLEWGISKTYTDYHKLIEDEDVELVEVLTPVYLHAEMAIAAAKAGKHVITEKPMCRTLKEADDMIYAAKANNVRLIVAESYLFTSTIMKAKQIIEEGEIGEPKVILEFSGPWVPKKSFNEKNFHKIDSQGVDWRKDPYQMGGGKFPYTFGHFCHFFSTARYLTNCNDIESIFAFPSYSDSSKGEISILQWRAGDISGSWVNNIENYAESGFRVKVFGTKGIIEVLGEAAGCKRFGKAMPHISMYREGQTQYLNIKTGEDEIWESSVGYYYEAQANELKHFIPCIVENKEPIYTAEDGKKEVMYTLAAIKSVIENRPICPKDMPLDFTPMNFV